MSTDRPTTQADGSLDPAATTPSRGRKRPLRTYSRRSAQARGQEQDEKDEGQSGTTPDLGREESPVQLPVLPKQEQAEQAKRPSRGSIMAYFKPLPTSSDKAPSDVASSDPAESPSTPPTSPPPAMKPRKRRRLTTRPQFSGLDRHSSEDVGDVLEASDESNEEVSRDQGHYSPLIGETSSLAGSEAGDTLRLRPALSEVATNTLDSQYIPVSALADRGPRTRKRPEKRQARDMTQTTLSLSVQKEPGFTICGVCDILYNPLNEKDRREHNRRHAAYSRHQKKAARR
ncbi:hypothetical protein C8A00DRAFT_14538 [Chaetomidium leptoderma]|uniref:N-acetyltransferase ESCO zinc-finger domain-containing protein n=1 Tax=Chaetomidium leptoderma TaxID=669021 RepID=A0AAN6VMJ0_9PEZI|nr:hypothetical protein C8A00DRAFT_14538 [Chaetomidium leptoderma]